MKSKVFFLILIVFLAGFLRFYKIEKIPPGINWDEASIGFNGYLISKIGRDEFGRKLPLSFRSYDDYKAPLVVYLSALVFKFLTVNEFSLRFPSAFLGTLTVLLTYFLTKELFRKSNVKYQLSLVSAFLLAVSPWHIHLSHALFEPNIAVFLITLAVLLFLKFVNAEEKESKKQWIYSFLSALFFSLSLYAYHSARGLTPLLIIGGLLVFGKKFYHKNHKIYLKKRYLFLFLGLFIVFSFPLLRLSFSLEVQRRMRSVSIFEQERGPLDRSIELLEVAEKQNVPFWLARVVHNRRLEYFKRLVIGYFYHFTPNFLFINAGNILMYKPAPGMGLLYVLELPFLLMGFYYLFKKKPKGFLFLVWWFLVVPAPASFTTGLPHVMRVGNFLPILQIFIAYGMVNFWQSLKKQKIKKIMFIGYPVRFLLYGVYVLLFTLNIFYFLHQYFVHNPLENSAQWQYGYRELAEAIKKEKDYNRVIVFVRQNEFGKNTLLEKAHGFLTFYFLPDPEGYLNSGGTHLCQNGVSGEIHFEKFDFYPLLCFDKLMLDEQIVALMGENNLVVIDPLDLKRRASGKTYREIKKIRYLDGRPAVMLIRT